MTDRFLKIIHDAAKAQYKDEECRVAYSCGGNYVYGYMLVKLRYTLKAHGCEWDEVQDIINQFEEGL